ncbi:hypothetical protein AgCh_038934 [Apium graveolens]
MELKQRDGSVAEYEAKFTELARFALDYVSSEAQKAKRFQQGLKPEIWSGVVVLQLKTYTSVVQAAIVIESDQKLTAKEREREKRNVDVIEDKQDQEESSQGFQKELKRIQTEDSGDRLYSKLGLVPLQLLPFQPNQSNRSCRAISQGSIGGSASQGPISNTARGKTFKITERSKA